MSQVTSSSLIGTFVAFTPAGAQTQACTYTGFARRLVDSIEMHIRMAFTGATANVLTITAPTINGVLYTISTSKIVDKAVIGSILGFRSGVAYYQGAVILNSDGTINAARAGSPALWGNAEPGAPANGDYNTLHIIVPIVEFGG